MILWFIKNLFKNKECKDTKKPTFTYLSNGFKQLALYYAFLIQYNTLKIKVTKKTMKTLIKSNKNQIELKLKTKEKFNFFCDEKLESFSSFS